MKAYNVHSLEHEHNLIFTGHLYIEYAEADTDFGLGNANLDTANMRACMA